MKILGILLALAVLGLAGIQAVVRFAPTDPARWHERPAPAFAGPGERDFGRGFIAVRETAAAPGEALERLDATILATPRTRRIAGSVAEGLLTYETRTAFWGFPDYTTVSAEAGDAATRIAIVGRSRFGGYDWGVNRSRITGWLAAAGL